MMGKPVLCRTPGTCSGTCSGSASAKQLGGEALDFCQELAQEQQLVSIPGPIGVLFGLDNRFEIENTHTELLGAELRELLRLSRCRCSG